MRATVRNTVQGAALIAACILPCFSQERAPARPQFYPVDTNTVGDIYTIAGNTLDAERGGYSGDGYSATNAQLSSPVALAFDAEGNLYISDAGNNRVRKVSAVTGIITTYAGGGSCSTSTVTYCGDGGLATNASLYNPAGLAFDKNGNLYIADMLNNVVRVVNAESKKISTYAGNGTASFSGDGAAATSAELNQPISLAFDQSGNLYIADSQNHRVREVTASNKQISTFAGGGSGCTGQTDPYGDGCAATDAPIDLAAWIAFDSKGDLYVIDQGNHLIREVQTNGTIIKALGAGPGSCAGETDNLGDGCPSGDVGFNVLNAIQFDSGGDLYISSGRYNNNPNVVQEISASSGNIDLTVGNSAGPGGYLYGGDSGPATSATVAAPWGTAFDPLGNLYIADAGNDLVREVICTVPPVTTPPTFSLQGGVYYGKQTVALKDTEPGAVIFYTTDGSKATPLSKQYTGPITVAATTTIDAVAVVPEYFPSNSVQEKFTIDQRRTDKPVISPPGLTSGVEVTVTITDQTAGGKIHYTTDGTIPTVSSPLYSKPISVTTPETIEAVAIAPNDAPSGVASETYIVAGAPMALTAQTTSITKTSATLNAAINPYGVAAHYYFEYGTTATELGSTTVAHSVAGADKAEAVSAAVTGLKSGKTYYYRVVATTIGGTSASAVEKFTTE